jgi:hypothetical protein
MPIISDDTSPSASPLEEINDCLNETILISTGIVLATPIGEPMTMETRPVQDIESQRVVNQSIIVGDDHLFMTAATDVVAVAVAVAVAESSQEQQSSPPHQQQMTTYLVRNLFYLLVLGGNVALIIWYRYMGFVVLGIFHCIMLVIVVLLRSKFC